MQNVAKIKSLKEVRIGFTKDIDFKTIRYLKELPKLTGLELCDVDLTNEAFEQISTFDKLLSLDLSNCRGVTPEGLRKLTVMKNLEHLKLAYSDVTDDGIKAIKGTNIWAIWIRNCTKLTDKCLVDIAEFKSLRVLDVTGNKQFAPHLVWKLKEKKLRLEIHNNNEPDKKAENFIFDNK